MSDEETLRAFVQQRIVEADRCRLCRRSLSEAVAELAEAGIARDQPFVNLGRPLRWDVCLTCRQQVLDRFEDVQRLLSEVWRQSEGGEWMLSRVDKGFE